MQNDSKFDRVLAVDPGFGRLGVAVMELRGDRNCLLFSCCIETKPKDKKEKRLFEIGFNIKKILKEWEPNSLAIESLFFNKNVRSAMGVAEARGVVLYEAMVGGLEVFEYSPQAVKIALTGSGNADKKQVELMVSRILSAENLAKRLDDEIDALALGITHLASRRRF